MSEAGRLGTASVAVIIVNYNAGPLLARALVALARQTVRPHRVIVIDNASSDGSIDGLDRHYPGVELVALAENAGFAAANNVGLELAEECEWVALLNPDVVVETAWLERLLDAARRNPEFAFFSSCLLDASEPRRYDGTGDAYHVSGIPIRRDHGRPVELAYRPEGEVFAPSAAAALFRRETVVRVGGFDERFFCYLEDVDLALRLRLAGERCLYVPDSVGLHVGSALTGKASDFTVYHSQRNAIWVWVKNMPSPLVWVYLPQHVLVNLGAVLVYMLLGRLEIVLRAKRDALRGLPPVLADRRAVQRARRVSAGDLRRVLDHGVAMYANPLRRAWETRARRPTRRSDAPPPAWSSQ